MKAAVLHGPRDFRIEDIDDPKCDPDGVIIQVKAIGICGSEFPLFVQGPPAEAVEERGLEAVTRSMLGHEWSGEVVEVGANVTDVNVGDRTIQAGYGGFLEYYAASRATLIPDDMSYEAAATVEPSCIGMNTAVTADPSPGDTVAVLGGGMIGQTAWQIFKAKGAGKVIVTDVSNVRLEAARGLGADVVINAAEENAVEKIFEVTDGEGVDVVVDAAGAEVTCKQAFEIVRGGGLYHMQFMWPEQEKATGQPVEWPAGFSPMAPGGTIVMVANYHYPTYGQPPAVFDWTPQTVINKTIKVVGCWGGKGQPEVLDLMQAGKINNVPLITHEFPMDRINEAFEAALKRDEAIKVLVRP